MSSSMILLFRLIHVVIGVTWAGGVFMLTLFILPGLRAAGPAAGPVMAQLMEKQKLSLWLMAFALLTVLSGGTLMWHDVHVTGAAFMASGSGRTFSAGAACAILAMLIGATVNAPTGKRLGVLGAEVRAGGGAPTAEQAAEIARLQARMTLAAKSAATLILLATAAMGVARYVP